MLTTRNDIQNRSWNGRVQPPCLHEWKVLVMLCPENQRGARDLIVQLRQARQCALVAGAHLGDETSHIVAAKTFPKVRAQPVGQSYAARKKRAFRPSKHKSGQAAKD